MAFISHTDQSHYNGIYKNLTKPGASMKIVNKQQDDPLLTVDTKQLITHYTN